MPSQLPNENGNRRPGTSTSAHEEDEQGWSVPGTGSVGSGRISGASGAGRTDLDGESIARAAAAEVRGSSTSDADESDGKNLKLDGTVGGARSTRDAGKRAGRRRKRSPRPVVRSVIM